MTNWSHRLINFNDSTFKLEEDDHIIVLKDKYPKACYHYLVLPKKNISSLNEVTKNDLKLLNYMEIIANKYIDQHEKHQFLVGYHAIPSMHRLHLHVISTDFNSLCLKNKKHWNSFTTLFFLPSKDICQHIEKYGEIKINDKIYEKYLNEKLKCHKCSYYPKNMPDLKNHIIEHITLK